MAVYARLSTQASQANADLTRKAKRFERLQTAWEQTPIGRAKKSKRALMFCAQAEVVEAEQAAASAKQAANDYFALLATTQAALLQSTHVPGPARGVYVVPARRQVQPRASSMRATATPFVPGRKTAKERDEAQLAGLFDAIARTEPVSKRLRSASSSLPDAESLGDLLPKKQKSHSRAVSDGGEAVLSSLSPIVPAEEQVDEKMDESDDDIGNIVEAYAGKVKKD